MSREARLVRVFVELADTLKTEFDVIEFLHNLADRTIELLRADAAGIVLTDQRGELRVLASTTGEIRLLELFELQNSEGPCLDCFRSGHPVVNVESDEAERRWPRFWPEAAREGYQSVHSLPLRLRADVLGAMNLFYLQPSRLTDDDIAVGQGFCDVATIGLMQARAVRHEAALAEQLQGALNSRIVIEQAKGILAEREQINVDEAFTRMRTSARRHRRRLGAVAGDIIAGSMTAADPQRQ